MAKCPVTVAFDHDGVSTLIYCGTWKCPRCAKMNAWKWSERAKAGLKAVQESENTDAWFLTLTLGSQFKTSQQGYAALPALWDTTRKAYQRYYHSFLYLAFVEGQGSRGGMPHFHILSGQQPPTKRGRRGYVTAHGVHDFAVAFGWGYQAKLVLVTGTQAAIYISKYASKGDPSMPRSFRRVRCSRDFPALPDLNGSPLLVPSRQEHEWQFCVRVAEETDVDVDTIYSRFREAEKRLYDERNNPNQ